MGNKVDQPDKRVVLAEDAEKFAALKNIPHFETSAKDNINVEAVSLKLIIRNNLLGGVFIFNNFVQYEAVPKIFSIRFLPFQAFDAITRLVLQAKKERISQQTDNSNGPIRVGPGDGTSSRGRDSSKKKCC